MTVLRILLGAALTGVACWACGIALLRRLRLDLLTRAEEHLLAFITGCPLLSLAVFALTALGQARTASFCILAALAVTAAWLAPRPGARAIVLPGFPLAWGIGVAAICAPFTVLYFFNALAPEHSPDGASYHLELVALYLRQHGFGRITTNMYASLSQGIEMLFLTAFSIGRHSAASVTHFLFLMALPALMLTWGRRFGRSKAAACAAVLVFASPVVGVAGTSAYNDVALACVVFALFYWLHLWSCTRNARLLIPAGLLAGFCYAIKYTAGIAVPAALVFIAWRSMRERRRLWRALIAVTALASLSMAPWMAKNWIVVANPFSPFLNRFFPNPYMHISFETEYVRHMRNYETVKGPADLLRKIIFDGEAVSGVLGPVFLLTPLALLAVRRTLGVWLLGTALVFGSAFLLNNGTRFLLPGLPFFSLALGVALERAPGALAALALFHAVASWPTVLTAYCSPYAWRLADIPVKAALRLIPETEYLESISPAFSAAAALDRHTPPGAKLFGFDSPPQAYTTRTVLVAYQSASNQLMGDFIYTAVLPAYQPTVRLRFDFPERTVEAVRVRLASVGDAPMWAVHELRLALRGKEVPRAAIWRGWAHPNPWDAQLAFDENEATAWKTWQPAEPGMYLEVSLVTPCPVDGLRIECLPDQVRFRTIVQGRAPGEGWVVLADRYTVESAAIKVNLRQKAMAALRGMGVSYMLVGDPDWFRADFETRSGEWGIKPVANLRGYRVYGLD